MLPSPGGVHGLSLWVSTKKITGSDLKLVPIRGEDMYRRCAADIFCQQSVANVPCCHDLPHPRLNPQCCLSLLEVVMQNKIGKITALLPSLKRFVKKNLGKILEGCVRSVMISPRKSKKHSCDRNNGRDGSFWSRWRGRARRGKVKRALELKAKATW